MGTTATDAMRMAIERAGGIPRLAELLGISPEAIYQWRRVPVQRVLVVAEVSGVPEWELRPDLYRRPETAA